MKTGIVFALITAGFVIYGLRDNNYPRKRISEPETSGNFCGTISDSREESMVKVPDVFKAKCATCHTKYKDGTGPQLFQVEQRLPDSTYFEKFVRSQNRLIKKKDKYTIAITESRVTDFIHEFKEITPSEMREMRKYFRH